MATIKSYNGRIPACGVFCGGCPVYVRDKKPCPGAEINTERCNKCKSFHICCVERGVSHCFECKTFPCSKLKRFSKSWIKYGQNMIENQSMLREIGEEEFKNHFNSKVDHSTWPPNQLTVYTIGRHNTLTMKATDAGGNGDITSFPPVLTRRLTLDSLAD